MLNDDVPWEMREARCRTHLNQRPKPKSILKHFKAYLSILKHSKLGVKMSSWHGNGLTILTGLKLTSLEIVEHRI
jgi:hypothetical protein